MALFFHGIILSHYNWYNLSETGHITADQIFATLALISENIVFMYMGMGVFTGKFKNWNIGFSALAFLFCLIGRAVNIFPLSWLANRFRRGRHHIPLKMQSVLWFVGLRGAIAFALSENMPGPNKATYETATLAICLFTTIICGGFTERILTMANMKQEESVVVTGEGTTEGDGIIYDSLLDSPILSQSVRTGLKGAWRNFDDRYIKPLFGGSEVRNDARGSNDQACDESARGDYELNKSDDTSIESDGS
eukprot:CAMPEP_0171323502 /NCGR_PEP_ID=MMETSP0816-20121228/115616_1 /TAXON_ID=420281 /ORGANISM="Proboscia inermis, Strain CCAP1064/1" /LENGTH=249 /DNA_ID=CAMNT_0011822227 /DNA_START=276 /DNA_END=1025 /DNA_ORIENTATION=+